MAAKARLALAWPGLALAAGAWGGERVTLSLNGEWKIEDSVDKEAMPREWHHRVPVPGLAHLAQPPFPEIDQFDSLEVITNRVQKGMLPESALVEGAGISRQERNYFWYATTFRPPARKQVAILRVNKAQFWHCGLAERQEDRRARGLLFGGLLQCHVCHQCRG
jgi:hypothetical protein